MAVGGGGVSALFFHGPITPGDVASWESEGVLIDGGGGGGGGMSIGGAVVGGTVGSVLFIGAGSTLAQDNAKFFWDDTGFVLKIQGELDFQATTATIKVNASNKLDFGVTTAGKWTSNASFMLDTFAHAYYIGTETAVLTVPNANGNNWFESGAGNFTLTGSGNMATGDQCMAFISTGVGNCGIGGVDPNGAGSGACFAVLSTGFHNMALGGGALSSLGSGSFNTAIGTVGLKRISSENFNTSIGDQVLEALGSGVGFGGNGGSFNIGIGALTFQVLQQGSGMIGIGTAGGNLTTSVGGDTFIGRSAANQMLTSGGSNTMIGFNAGQFLIGGTGNTIIGSWTTPIAGVTLNNVLGIAVNSNVLIIDYSYIVNNIFSFQNTTTKTGLHVYNTLDSIDTPTNWERGVFDWNVAANVLVIGTQKAGTGSTRNLEFIIGGTNKLDYGVTNAGLWTFAQATMFATSVALTNGAAASLGTLTNAPAAGDPTKWIPINDNGTTRFIPAW